MSDIPLIQAAKLWRKTSAGGRTYLTGRMGGLRVLVFENARRGDDEAEATHLLMIGAANTSAREKPAQRREAAGQSSPPAPTPDRAPAGAGAPRRDGPAAEGAERADGFDWARGDPLPFG